MDLRGEIPHTRRNVEEQREMRWREGSWSRGDAFVIAERPGHKIKADELGDVQGQG